MLQLRRSNIALILIVFVFVFASIHILGAAPTGDPSSPDQSGRSGWRDWKWPGYGEKDKDGGRWSDSQASASKGATGNKAAGPSPPQQTTSVPAKAAQPSPKPAPPAEPAKAKPNGENKAGDGDKKKEGNKEQTPAPPPPKAPDASADKDKCRSDQAWHSPMLSSLNTTFEVADDIFYDPAGPRADQIIILTATDGGGHNGGIANIVERSTANRQAYCDYQGYRHHFVNISRFDLDGAHPVWKKLPAIVDAFNTYPDAQWVWMLDLDAIVMTPTADLRDILLSQRGLQQALHSGSELHVKNWSGLGMFVPDQIDFTKTDFLVSQDHNGINAGSFFVRRSHFTQLFIDMWADPFFRKMNWPGQEQEALIHFVKHHPVFRRHLGIIKQRVANAFCEGGPEMNWQEGDLLVHFAGCWVNDKCVERWESFWARRGEVPSGFNGDSTKPEVDGGSLD